MKKLKVEIQSLNDEVTKFDDSYEPSFVKAVSAQPELLDDIVNVRKQLNSKKKDVSKERKERYCNKFLLNHVSNTRVYH